MSVRVKIKNIMHTKIYRSFCLLFLTILFCGNIYGQYTIKSERAIRFFESGTRNFSLYYYDEAEDDLTKAIEVEPEFVEDYLVLADLYAVQKEYEKVVENYEKAFSLKPGFYPGGYLKLGKAYFNIGQYVSARKYLTEYAREYAKSPKDKSEAERLLQSCSFAEKAVQNPVPFEPVNLGDNINSDNNEYWPSLSADGQILVFTVLLPIDPLNSATRFNRQEDFYISYDTNGTWSVAEPLGPPINTPENEGAQSLSADGRMMFFTACNNPDGFGQCDIFYSEKSAGRWSRPMNLGSAINSSHSEKQPSISPDGRTLYFISDRPGGKGGFDIWISDYLGSGKWSKPKNLGDTINTTGHEQSPFIHADNKTFYFTSDGQVGMGGFDIFKSAKIDSGKWEKPVNLGYPINTWNDEMGLIVDAAGKKAYYSSTRDEKKGNDLYYFELPESARPVSVSYMKGIVYDAEKGFPLGADFELIKLSSGKTSFKSYSDPNTGEFLVCIPAENDYALNVSRPGYLFYSDNFAFKGVHEISDPFHVNVPLQPIKEGVSVVLKNIFFETDSYVLKDESKVELEKLIQFLNTNESVIIEVAGHTDNVGTDEYNMELSLNRANSVVKYLINSGISGSRLVAKGYGETKPVTSNETKEGRALNRRTEFTILDK